MQCRHVIDTYLIKHTVNKIHHTSDDTDAHQCYCKTCTNRLHNKYTQWSYAHAIVGKELRTELYWNTVWTKNTLLLTPVLLKEESSFSVTTNFPPKKRPKRNFPETEKRLASSKETVAGFSHAPNKKMAWILDCSFIISKTVGSIPSIKETSLVFDDKRERCAVDWMSWNGRSFFLQRILQWKGNYNTQKYQQEVLPANLQFLDPLQSYPTEMVALHWIWVQTVLQLCLHKNFIFMKTFFYYHLR